MVTRHCQLAHPASIMKRKRLMRSGLLDREIVMADSQPSNSFSWGDALFLYIERPGQPLSIACVSIFDGPVSLKSVRDLVESKLPLIPRYRQHVVFPPFNIGLPSWEFDPKFDIRNHIRQVTLRRGTESDLKVLTSQIVSTHLERDKPLWDLTLVRGLEGNRTGLIARIHHCLADGLAGVGIINVLMDQSPVVAPLPRKKPTAPEAKPRDAGAQLLDSLLKSYFSAVKGALTLHGEAVSIAQQMFSDAAEPLADLMNIMPELAAPAERLPFNVVCHGPQKFGWTEIAMADIQTLRQRCGGTVNDVILTVVAATLRRYSELRGVRLKGRSVRIMIPVNVRGNNSVSELGNRIYFLPVTIPLDVRDPQKLFAHVRERMEFLKRIRAAELVGFAGGLFATIPTPIWAAIGPVASQLPLSLCNIICTNVPGPQVPLYLLGRKMLSFYPYVPIGGEMGVNCAILSYNGTAYFGFTCDVGAVPDPQNLEKFVKTSFAELCESGKRFKAKAPAVTKPETAKRTNRTKRTRPNAEIPVAAKRVRPNGGIPAETRPKRVRKAATAKIEMAAPVPPASVTTSEGQSEQAEEKAFAVGA
jgi:diacylglycerol O-acyltransferase / wax synthase